jgi:hypothetical protein
MKPIIGLASDIHPIRGYRKGPYFLITSITATGALWVIGASTQSSLPVQAVVLCLFLAALQTSTCDLLAEAKYAEKIQANPSRGPDLLTYVWSGIQLGGLVALGLSGIVIATFGSQVPFVIAAVPSAFMILPVLSGYLEESPLSEEDVHKLRTKFYEQVEACVLCFVMLIATVSISVCGFLCKNPRNNALLAIGIMIVVIASFSIFLSPAIAKFNAFSILQGSLSLSISGATFYFFTDTPQQYPEGPHFTPFFYTTVIGIIGSSCSLLGIYFYNCYMTGWRYRNLLVMANVIYTVLTAIDIVMFTRVNVRWGIPDQFFVLSSGAMEHVVGQWMYMPQVVLLSYLCPKGMEATMYALLAGCANLGNNISSIVGAWLLEELNCRPSGADAESGQFENLWKAAAVSVTLPAATIVLIFWMVPDAKQGDTIIDPTVEGGATAGSMWRRWMDTP